MAGCTDIAFRLVARKLGLELAFTEMISAEALARAHIKTRLLLRSVRSDHPLGAQIVGHNPASMGEAASIIESLKFPILDLNFGCPVRKIIVHGAGAALLRTPDLAQKILKNVMARVQKIPVTLKTRIGFEDPSGKEAVRLGLMAQDLGVAAITLHGRTQAQGYSGHADWSIIRLVKKKLRIPVFGNGDVFAPEDALRMFENTGCDGVCVGRGALGNPWIYRGIQRLLKGKPPIVPSFEEKKKVALSHIKLEAKYEGEKIGVLQSRKIVCWYFKGCPNAAALREKINRTTQLKEMLAIIVDFRGENPS